MRFNFHKYEDYKKCPRKYKMSEDRVKPSKPPNEYFTLFGNLIQKFFELYANEWKRERLVLTEPVIRQKLKPLWEKILGYAKVNWSAPFARLSASDIYEEAVVDIIKNLDILDVYDRTKSEVKIEVTFKSGDVLPLVAAHGGAEQVAGGLRGGGRCGRHAARSCFDQRSFCIVPP